MGVGACAKLTAMSGHPVPATKPPKAPRRGKGMSLDVFMPENRLSRKRAEARRRTVKRWFNRLLHRLHQTPS